MKIYEIPMRSKLQIRVVQGDARFEMFGYVVGRRGQKIYMRPLRYKGKLINFDSNKVQVMAFYVEGSEPMGWNACVIRREMVAGKNYHVIVCGKDSVKINRRGETRVPVKFYGDSRVKSHGRNIYTQIVDVSLSGIGFITREEIEERDYAPLNIHFYDDKDKPISIMVKVIRKNEIEDGYRYGAMLMQSNDTWLMFVNRMNIKMRQEKRKEEKRIEKMAGF